MVAEEGARLRRMLTALLSKCANITLDRLSGLHKALVEKRFIGSFGMLVASQKI